MSNSITPNAKRGYNAAVLDLSFVGVDHLKKVVARSAAIEMPPSDKQFYVGIQAAIDEHESKSEATR